KNYTEKYGQ
ncbi:MAG: hypothetical protein COW35_02325, partial [Candidatus Infernicultor aquiphilus]